MAAAAASQTRPGAAQVNDLAAEPDLALDEISSVAK